MDDKVRRQIYEVTMREGRPPRAAHLASTLRLRLDEVQASLRRLAEGRMIALQRDAVEILMAGPFSAAPTPFHVETGGVSAFGNCIWDALGIPAMLQSDAVIQTSCADCGTSVILLIRDGELEDDGGLMHFVIPARFWWKDIVFT